VDVLRRQLVSARHADSWQCAAAATARPGSDDATALVVPDSAAGTELGLF
jgi:hypothetical protein